MNTVFEVGMMFIVGDQMNLGKTELTMFNSHINKH